MANEKVTLRFEEFDNDTDNTIISSGPISLHGSVDSVLDLNEYTVPTLDTEGETPTVIVFVKKVTDIDESLSQRNRGAYFKYNYDTGSWTEILLGTHSHENKEFLDKLGAFDLTTQNMGKGMLVLDVDSPDNGLSYEYDVRFEEIPQSLPLIPEEASPSPLYLSVKNSGTAVNNIVGTLSNSLVTVNGTETMTVGVVSLSSGSTADLVVGQKIIQVSQGINQGYFGDYAEIAEIVDETTFHTNVPHITEGPVTFSILIKRDAEWSNQFIPSQTFTVKSSSPNGSVVTFTDVVYNPSGDTILLIDDQLLFQAEDAEISYSDSTLTISLSGGRVFSSSKVTLIILRNGTDAVLDELASNYYSKDDALNILSGGSVRLKDYAKKSDLRNKANRYHTHSQFSKVGHDHDYRYANYNHTHSEYMTRAKVLEEIGKVVYLNPDILDTMSSISQFLEQFTGVRELYQYNGTDWVKVSSFYTDEPASPQNGDVWLDETVFKIYNGSWTTIEVSLVRPLSPSLNQYYYMSVLDYFLLSLPTYGQFEEINAKIDAVNESLDAMFNSSYVSSSPGYRDLHAQLESYLSSRIFRADQVEMYDPKTQTIQNIETIITDIRQDIEEDLGNVNTDDLLLAEDIEVKLGPGESVGQYGSQSDNHNNIELLTTGRTMTHILRDLLIKRIPPVYTEPTVTHTINVERYPEKGSTIDLSINSEFTQNDAGVLSLYDVKANGVSIYSRSELPESTQEFTLPLTVGASPISITVEFHYDEGPDKVNNFGETDQTGKISSGVIIREFSQITPVDALLKGYSEDDYPTSGQGAFIRANTSPHTNSYPYISVEQELIVLKGSRTIMFALPSTVGADKIKILYKEQGNIDILDKFTVINDVLVPVPGSTPVSYRVYLYEVPRYSYLQGGVTVTKYLSIEEEMTLTFVKGS